MKIVHSLNLQQKESALSTNSHNLVIASAGTGKTSTIMARIEFLLDSGIEPKKIMLITFTNKAAKEMQERLSKHFNKSIVETITTGTFHSIAFRMIFPFYPNLKILNDTESLLMFNNAYFTAGLKRNAVSDIQMSSKSLFHYINKFSCQRKYNNFEEYIDNILLNGSRQNLSLYCKAYELFKKNKINTNSFQFNDLIEYAILFSEELGINKFEHIIIDEYQDTNPLQEAFHEIANPKTLFCVGDYDQSIYAFNGADINIISSFENNYKDASVFNLFDNYRSAPAIIDLAEGIIGINPRIYPKKIVAKYQGKTGNEKPQMLEFENTTEQYDSIATSILSIPENRRGDVAILFRGNSSTIGLELSLNELNIDYQRKSGKSYFEQDNIMKYIACIKVVDGSYNLKDFMVAYSRYDIRSTVFNEFIENIKNHQEKTIDYPTLAHGLHQYSDFPYLLIEKYSKIRNSIKNIKKTDILIKKIFESDFVETLTKDLYVEIDDDERNKRKDYIKEIFINIAQKHKNLKSFFNSLNKKENADENNSCKVQIMSIHASKGLEFNTVFIVDMVEKMFPNQRLISMGGSIEEERRLFYVAITRAKNNLWLCYPKSNINGKFNKPSEFLKEGRFIRE